MCHPPQVNVCVTKNDKGDRLPQVLFDYGLGVHDDMSLVFLFFEGDTKHNHTV